MGMRDWLSIIVIVGIILILLDGYRRKRKDRIQVKIEKNIPAHGGEFEDAVELPNDDARIISRDNDVDDDGEYPNDEDDQDDQIVPVLMDAVDIGNDIAKKEMAESSISSEESSAKEDHVEDYEDVAEGAEDESLEETPEETTEETNTNYSDLDEQVHDALNDDEKISSVRISNREEKQKSTESNNSAVSQARIESTLGAMDSFSDAELEDRHTGGQAELFSENPEDFIQTDDEHDENEEGYLEPEEVIVINVMAKQGELFSGSDLLPILLQQDMRLGKMSIFHKHADSSGNGPVMFSMANMVKPGTFDVTQMEEFSTPGVSFFLQLPNAFGNMKGFEQMLNAADSIKESLNADLKDEHRSVITRQTIEHCRQRIQDFELAQLSKK